MNRQETITAIATGQGGAISLIRVGGSDAIAICDRIFVAKSGKKLSSQKGYTVHFGQIYDNNELVDEVIVTLFKAPNSYTGEDLVEISCHGSSYISKRIIETLTHSGATLAKGGEFTLRAFLNGKLDLTQAEAVADIIAADNRINHSVALNQIRGGYSQQLKALRDKLLELTSLLELELDFSQEDVEFADRTRLLEIVGQLKERVKTLAESFKQGNVIKNGVPVALIGAPNVGKSTLLNRLLNEDRAMVSDIAGTTRDVIEDTVTLHGITYRFIDTAGIRHTHDKLEAMGIERSLTKMSQAAVVLLIVDASESVSEIVARYAALNTTADQHIVLVLNKSDLCDSAEIVAKRAEISTQLPLVHIVDISAMCGKGIDSLISVLSALYDDSSAAGIGDGVIVTNLRHYEALEAAYRGLYDSERAINDSLPSDLIVEDIRNVIYQIGLITGEITTDDILGTIFSKFCIGK